MANPEKATDKELLERLSRVITNRGDPGTLADFGSLQSAFNDPKGEKISPTAARMLADAAGPDGSPMARELLATALRNDRITGNPDIDSRLRELNLKTDVGGNLEEFVSKEEADKLISEIDKIFLGHGAPYKLYGTESEDLEKNAASHGIEFIQIPQRHI